MLLQVWLPDRATRLIIGTESIWEAFDTCYKAAAMLRGVSIDSAAAVLLQKAASKRGSVREDMTVLVAELVPEGMSSFKDQVRLVTHPVLVTKMAPEQDEPLRMLWKSIVICA